MLPWIGRAVAEQLPTPPSGLLPSPNDLVPGESLQDRFDRRTLVPATQIGAFAVQPSAYAELGFNDNIFAQDTDMKSDFVVDYGGKLDIDYRRDRTRAHLALGATDHRYLTQSNEDYWEANTRLSLFQQIRDDMQLFAQGGVQRLAVPRTDPNTIEGFKPATFLLYDEATGLQFGDPTGTLLTVSAGFDSSVYDKSYGALGLIDTKERNREEVFGDVRLDHYFFGRQEVYVELRPDGRSYGQEVDSAGYRRASNGVRADAGLTLDLDAALLVELSGGYQQQDYADPRFGTIGEPDVTVTVRWQPTPRTQVDTSYLHEYYEDVYTASPGYVHDMTSVTVSQELRRSLLVSAGFIYDARTLERSPRNYDIRTAEGKIQYAITDNLVGVLDYTFQNLTSNTTRRFDDNIVLLKFVRKF